MTGIRTYREEDFLAVSELLIRNSVYDRLSVSLISEKLYADPDWNPGSVLIAEKNGLIIGFMMGVRRDIRGTKYGYIKLMAVDAPHRREGIATSLYKKMEQYFLEQVIEIVRIYDVPMNYLVPGIDPQYTEAVCFAMKTGFIKTGEAVNMSVDLNWSDWDTSSETDALEKEKISIRRAKTNDTSAILKLIEKEWALWKHELMTAISNEPATLFIAIYEEEVVAFSAYDGNNIGTGWFGPMGTDPAFRGHGLGKILLFRCLKEMQEKGLDSAVIPWVAPIGFYAHFANARINRTFWRYEKKIKL